MSAQNNAINSANNGKMGMFNPRNWSVRGKARLNFLVRAVVAISLLLLLINVIQRTISIREVYSRLSILNDTKSRYVEDYFNHLDQQIRTLAADRQTVEAFTRLTEAFSNIENDNYQTPAANDLEKCSVLLEGFYKTEVLPLLDESDKNMNMGLLLPADNKQRILQYLYIAGNERPVGLKGMLNKGNDQSSYSYMHSLYHPELMRLARQAKVNDIIFADYRTGYVTYSIRKNLDFATNLFEGPYKNSGLGTAFKKALALTDGSVVYTDVSVYMPALYQPRLFISTPVFSGNQLSGVLIIAISSDETTNLLAYDKSVTVTNETLKTIIVGDDLKYRCDDPEFLVNKKKYIRQLKNNAANGETAEKAELYGTTAMVQPVDHLAFASARSGKEGIASYRTETGRKVFCGYKPLKIDGLKWILITQLNRSEALAPLHRLLFLMVFVALFIATLLFYISGFTSNSFESRLGKIKNNMLHLLQGERIKEPDLDSMDEIGVINNTLNRLEERIHESAEFVNALSEGNVDRDFAVYGDTDKIGLALNNLKKNILIQRQEEEKRKKEDEIRNWNTQGVAMFNDILRTDNDNLDKLSFNIIRNLVQYLSANQGGLFIIEDQGEDKHLNLVAAYAFDRQKYIQKRIQIGEGLAGTCVIEKKTILTNKIPDGYITITSGLGGAKPKCLMVVPLKKDDEIMGVLEIASFEDFKPHEVEFVEKIAESIASALITVKLHLQTKEYLERFQQQAEEMKSQDEELRQNIEEMQATHEQMERLKQEENERTQKMIKEMDDYRKLLISVLNEVPEKIFLKDDKGRFVIANKQVADNYGKTVEELLGKSDFDFYPRNQAAEYFQREQEIVNSGQTQSFEEGDPSKEDGLIVRSVKKPFYIEHLGVTGLFGVQIDISDIKRKEFDAIRLSEELAGKQKEIETASIQLMHEKSLMDALMDNIPEYIYFKDLKSRFIRISRSMFNLFNVNTIEEILGKSDFDFFGDEHAKPAYEAEQDIIRTGRPLIDLQEKEVHNDGRITWANTSKMPLRNKAGEIIGTFGISKDITKIKILEQQAQETTEELKAQEEELRQNLEEMMATQEDMKRQLEENERMSKELGQEKSLMDALMDNVQESIYFKDKQSRFIRVSKSMFKLFNVKSITEIAGKSDFDFFGEEHAKPAYEAEQEIIRTGKAVIDLQEKEVHMDGRTSWVNTSKMPLRNKEGEIIGTFGISKDITKIKMLEQQALETTEELKAQEEELRQNLEEMMTTQEDMKRQLEENEKMSKALGREKSLMDALMNSLPEHIYFKDKQSRFIRFSRSLLSMFGLKKEEELLGKSDFDFFSEEHARPAFESEQKIIKSGKAMIDMEEKEVLNDGTVNWVNTTKMPLVDEKGDIIGTFGISKNITRIKQLEIEGKEKAETLKLTQQKLAALEKEIARLKGGK